MNDYWTSKKTLQMLASGVECMGMRYYVGGGPVPAGGKHRDNGHYLQHLAELAAHLKSDQQSFQNFIVSFEMLIAGHLVGPGMPLTPAQRNSGVIRDLTKADTILARLGKNTADPWQKSSIHAVRGVIARFQREARQKNRPPSPRTAAHGHPRRSSEK